MATQPPLAASVAGTRRKVPAALSLDSFQRLSMQQHKHDWQCKPVSTEPALASSMVGSKSVSRKAIDDEFSSDSDG